MWKKTADGYVNLDNAVEMQKKKQNENRWSVWVRDVIGGTHVIYITESEEAVDKYMEGLVDVLFQMEFKGK